MVLGGGRKSHDVIVDDDWVSMKLVYGSRTCKLWSNVFLWGEWENVHRSRWHGEKGRGLGDGDHVTQHLG